MLREVWRALYWWFRDLRFRNLFRDDVVFVFFGESLGDDIMCTALMRELKRRGSEEICFITKFGELFADTSFIDRVLPVDMAYVDALRRKSLMLLLPSYWRENAGEDVDSPPSRHFIKELCGRVGVENEIDNYPEIHIPTERLSRFSDYSDAILLCAGVAGAKTPMLNKIWSHRRFQEVVDIVVKDGFRVVQVGLEVDPALLGCEDLRGKVSIAELAAIISVSRHLVGYPGALMHLARAVNTSATIIFGGREDPEISGYREFRNLVGKTECSPCWLRNNCDFDRLCLDMVEVDDVVAAIYKELSTSRDVICNKD